MGDHIQVAKGMAPWLPTSDSHLVAEYAYHDFPTAGVIQQQGVEFLFRSIVDPEREVSIWIYTLLHGNERALIEAAATPEDFRKIMSRVQSRQPLTVAIALEDVGILSYTRTSLRYGPDALKEAVDQLVAELRDVAEDAERVTSPC